MRDKKIIIGIFGTQCVGKSTLVNDIVASDSNSILFGKDYRDIINEHGLKINREGTEECQKIIHRTLCENVIDAEMYSGKNVLIMDRTPIDSFVYTLWHNIYGDKTIQHSTIRNMFEDVVRYATIFDYLCWIPLSECEDITVVDDKFRDTNVEYREQIDGLMGRMYESLKKKQCNMEMIYGSREERKEKIFKLF